MGRFEHGRRGAAGRLPATLAVALLAAIIGLGCLAAGVTADVLPPSQAGVNVYDFAGIWSDAAKQHAQAVANEVKTRTGAEIAVVSWPSGQSSVSTGGAGYDAHMILDAWGVGRPGVYDGLVVLFDMDTTNRHGQIFLATGSGFQSMYLSDTEAASIVDGDMLPKAKDGDLDGALTAGIDHVDRIVQPGGNPERAFTSALRLGGAILLSLLGLAILAWFLQTWWRRGRDARTPLIDDSVLLPEPPPKLTPALATVLRDDMISKDSFTSALVDLGHRGLVTFKEAGGIAGIGSHVDLVVPSEPLDDAASQSARTRPLGTAEHGLAQDIDGATDAEGVLDSTRLKSGIGKSLFDHFKKHMGVEAEASGWFNDDPNHLAGRWSAIGIVVAVAAAIGFFIFAVAPSEDPEILVPGAEPLAVGFGVVFLVGLVVAIGSRYLPARTADGAQTLAMALAYRNTLRYEIQNAQTVGQAVEATKRKLPWVATPDILTVWAVALGLNHEIDHLIKQTFETEGSTGTTSGLWTPLWFSGGSSGWSGIGGASGLTGAIGSISTSAASSSGGGFSGGGGGGGGGGAGGGF